MRQNKRPLLLVILIYWLSQGILYMGWYERIIRVTGELILITVFSIILSNTLLEITLLVIFVHSSFFIFNSNIICVVREIVNKYSNRRKLYLFFKEISYLFEKKDIGGAFISGSFANGKLNNNSDIDLRIIIEKNITKALKAFAFVNYLRFYAMVNRFPLDVYFFTINEATNRLKPNEKIIILFDPKEIITKSISQKRIAKHHKKKI